MMSILVKSDDVRSGRKAKGRHGPLWRLRSQWVDGLLIKLNLFGLKQRARLLSFVMSQST